MEWGYGLTLTSLYGHARTNESHSIRIRHMITKMDAKILCAALVAIALLSVSRVASFAVDPTGTWRTEDDATVRVSNCGGALCATIASLREPNDPQTGKPKTDIHNGD